MNHKISTHHAPAQRALVLKQLKQQHFWAWFWLTTSVNMIVLGLLTWGFIWMLNIVLTTPSCRLMGTC